MEYTQERIATLHRLTDDPPPRGLVGSQTLERTAVVVPMTEREHASPAATRVLSTLETLAPAHVFVPVRASPERIDAVREWLESFSLSLSVLWCTAPSVTDLLTETGLANGFGKGRDVWLALGPAAEVGEYVVVHDADASSYDRAHVERLLAPLTMGYDFSKGYYARVEDGRLYGRLCRLLYEPLVRVLETDHDAPVLSYLGSFRYALAGEFATTAALARRLRAQRAWGLEIGTLGDAFAHAGFAGTAQVDLGRHEHDHRAVDGDAGLEGMSHQVAAALFRVLDDHGVAPAYSRLRERYLEVGSTLIDQYAADARFNGLAYDPADERGQLTRYADAISPPGLDRRLPPWTDAPFTPAAVRDAATPWLE
ncbi:glycosyltransferase family protein [Natronobiforma cellulositropha]|uniref:glycosyl transferase family 2 n=1 Tax=Natronobiforma cellulositropha TaxID=1679076 RepID=UPI0021D59E22|nr:glycosyl transferase family 2 [Natronobiforma cellulositropha]